MRAEKLINYAETQSWKPGKSRGVFCGFVLVPRKRSSGAKPPYQTEKKPRGGGRRKTIRWGYYEVFKKQEGAQVRTWSQKKRLMV